MKKLIVMMMLAVLMVGCGKGDKIETAFSEYAEAESIPNYKGISSIECTDSLPFEDVANVSKIRFQVDSIQKLLTSKVEEMTEFYSKLSSSKKQQLATEYARIGAECGDLWVNKTRNNDETINELKNALDDLSPYKEPLYIYKIIAKVGTNDIPFYGFSCGEDISFVKADDLSDAMRKNEKLVKFQDAMMNVVRKDMVPYSVLIDDIDNLMGNDK